MEVKILVPKPNSLVSNYGLTILQPCDLGQVKFSVPQFPHQWLPYGLSREAEKMIHVESLAQCLAQCRRLVSDSRC